jgi:hypothetical protein
MPSAKTRALVGVDQYGNLLGPDDTELDGRAKAFCNRWGWKLDRPAMLADLRKLLAYAQTGAEEEDDFGRRLREQEQRRA